MRFRILYGDRIAVGATVRLKADAMAVDEHRRLLLVRQSDTGLWTLPGGTIDPGESAAEAALRELREETGYSGVVSALIGVYSSPDRVVEYSSGERQQIVSLAFLVVPGTRVAAPEDYTSDVGFFALDQVDALEVVPGHELRIADAFAFSGTTFIR